MKVRSTMKKALVPFIQRLTKEDKLAGFDAHKLKHAVLDVFLNESFSENRSIYINKIKGK